MPSTFSDAVAVLTMIINKLDSVYITEIWLNQIQYYLSLLDLLEIIFGINVIRVLMSDVMGVHSKAESR